MNTATLVEIAGWSGAAALLSGYYLIQTKRVEHDHRMYMFLNIIGSLLLAINTSYHRAYPSVVTNLVWFIIGVGSAMNLF
jgi:hypothetical protein